MDSLLEDSLRAPSAGNTSAVEFLLLEGQEEVGSYWDITLPGDKRSAFRWQQLLDAPVLILVTTRPTSYPERYAEPDKARDSLSQSTDQWPIPYWYLDAGCVVQNLLLSATDVGLGACLFGLFSHEQAVAARFGVPSDTRIVAAIALGRPLSDEPGRSSNRSRPKLAQVVHRQRW
jgi:nitroreductase